MSHWWGYQLCYSLEDKRWAIERKVTSLQSGVCYARKRKVSRYRLLNTLGDNCTIKGELKFQPAKGHKSKTVIHRRLSDHIREKDMLMLAKLTKMVNGIDRRIVSNLS